MVGWFGVRRGVERGGSLCTMGRVIRGQRKGNGGIFKSHVRTRKGAAKSAAAAANAVRGNGAAWRRDPDRP